MQDNRIVFVELAQTCKICIVLAGKLLHKLITPYRAVNSDISVNLNWNLTEKNWISLTETETIIEKKLKTETETK